MTEALTTDDSGGGDTGRGAWLQGRGGNEKPRRASGVTFLVSTGHTAALRPGCPHGHQRALSSESGIRLFKWICKG